MCCGVSVDTGMALRIYGLNLGFGSADSQQAFVDGVHMP
jgi:hypothetical protein